MTMSRRILLAVAALAMVAVIALLVLMPVVENVWNVVAARGFEIPDESSIFTFVVTEMNEGSGEWWLHGEDSRYFYACSDTEGIRYHAFPKSKVAECAGFRPDDSATWCAAFTRSPRAL